MRLTVLGNAADYLAPGSGGSGYLVEEEGTRVLLDCGGGIADALADAASLDAVVLSHFHHDHVLDLLRLKDALRPGTPLIVPHGERARLDDLGRAFAFRGAFDPPGPVREADAPLTVGALTLSFAPTRHSAPSFATRIGGLCYASDTAPCAELTRLARGCDLLLMHALLARVDPTSDHAARHSTAETAARTAREAGARRLLLSHRHHQTKDEDVRAAAPGALLARTGDAYDVAPR